MSHRTPRINNLDSKAVKLSFIDVPATTIQNRAQIPDLANDLSAHAGMTRILTQEVHTLLDEEGPTGEKVWGAMNDKFNQIRFVGDGWESNIGPNGPGDTVTTSPDDYLEVVFYGTGLNILTFNDNSANDWRVSVDGGAEGGNVWPSPGGSGSDVLGSRNYSSIVSVNIVSGLSQGLHTVKVRLASGSFLTCMGIDLVNESNQLKVNPGNLVNGQSVASHSSLLDSGFNSETGTDVGMGGAVLVYVDEDGNIKKDINWAPNNQQNLSSADHSNEEIIARYAYFREFGVGLSEDFGDVVNSVEDLGYTLDDNATSLCAENVQTDSSHGSLFNGSSGDYIMFTFVGTGLDIRLREDSTTNEHAFEVDGASIGNLPSGGDGNERWVKIVSGLPYGTHVVRMEKTATGSGGARPLQGFRAWGPKSPTLPDGATPIAAYNIVADYDGTTATGTTNNDYDEVPQGTILKASGREWRYEGTWAFSAFVPDTPLPFLPFTSTNGDKASLTFFGTGINLFLKDHSSPSNLNIRIDGALDNTGVARANMSNDTGGAYTITSSSNVQPARVEFTGLSLGIHTIEIEKTGGGNLAIHGAHVITPIHYHKLNGPAIRNNSLRNGSTGVLDLRPLLSSQIRESSESGWSTNSIAAHVTTDTEYVPMSNNMISFFSPEGGDYLVEWSGIQNKSGSGEIFITLYLDGIQIEDAFTQISDSGRRQMATHAKISVGPGQHFIYAAQRQTSAATASMSFDKLSVVKIGDRK